LKPFLVDSMRADKNNSCNAVFIHADGQGLTMFIQQQSGPETTAQRPKEFYSNHSQNHGSRQGGHKDGHSLYRQGEFAWFRDPEQPHIAERQVRICKNNPVLLFCNVRLRYYDCDTYRVSVPALYRAYLSFCQERDLITINRIHFGRMFKRCIPQARKGKLYSTREDAWIGISLIDPAAGVPPPSPLLALDSATSG
jgi:hypothetical protein